jgi:NTP pyrophosphatase (non-canonical NTP hydrolase)
MFKVGDKVTPEHPDACPEHTHLQFGAVYTVTKVSDSGGSICLAEVRNDINAEGSYVVNRFVLATEPINTTPAPESLLPPPSFSEKVIEEALNEACKSIHRSNVDAGWWDAKDNPLVVPTKMALIHSEVSEAMEGHRKGLMDDHLPHRTMLACELADIFIRVADLAGFLGIDLGTVIAEKAAYNKARADHKPENRAKKGGKKY